MKKNYMVIVAFLLLFAHSSIADEITILTEDLPPLNFVKDGVLVGPAVEIVKEIQRRVASNEKIQLYPWARAYKMALEEENIILFGMARTKERENKFYWIGPIAKKRDILVAKKDSSIKIINLEDAKKVDYIGTLRDDAKEIFLKKHGFANLVSTHDDLKNAKRLIYGRIDLWATKKPGLKTSCDLAGVNYNDIKEVFTMRESEISIAISKKTSNAVFKAWQDAFDEMSADGTLLRIQKIWNQKLEDDPFPEITD